MHQAYSFAARSMITIMTEAQLVELIEERHARGMNEAQLAEFEIWHRARLGQDGIPPLSP